MKSTGILAFAAAIFTVFPAAAQTNFTATPILQSGATIHDAPIAYPETDSPEITALLVEIGPGGESGRHMHPNPTFVYVLEGTLDVEMEGMSHSYKAGDAFPRSDEHLAQREEQGERARQVPRRLLGRGGQAESGPA